MTDRRATAGVLYGLAAYLWWGLCPIYFKAVAHIPPWEVLAHRIIWSLLLLLVVIGRRGQLQQTWQQIRRRRILLALSASTILISVNWFTFIWAVGNDRVLQASLGYFISPLVTVLLGLVVLRERLRSWQWVSLALAAGGVALLGVRLGGLPTVSLLLAFSFALYGLIRKTVAVGATAGLTVETALLAPIAAGALGIWHFQGTLVFGHASFTDDVLLALGGVVTALPLIWFACAARRLRFATLGFLQYLAPSLQFLLAVVVYHEPFRRQELLSFALIWLALILYSAGTLGRRGPQVATKIADPSRR